jgi:O-antigen/teichoic acid export membrane protein
MMFVNVPVMLGLAVVADPLVLVLFGEKWLPAAPILQVVCLAGVLWPLHTANLNALMALGRSELFFRIEMLKKIVGLTVVVAASFHSVMAVAWAQVFLGVVAFFINAHYSKVFLAYGPLKQMADVTPFFVAATGMAMLVWSMQSLLEAQPIIELVSLVGIGVLSYLLLLWVIKRDLLIEHLAHVARMLGVLKC